MLALTDVFIMHSFFGFWSMYLVKHSVGCNLQSQNSRLYRPSIQNVIKAMGDSLLIHEFAYSLFTGLCSVTSNMTG